MLLGLLGVEGEEEEEIVATGGMGIVVVEEDVAVIAEAGVHLHVITILVLGMCLSSPCCGGVAVNVMTTFGIFTGFCILLTSAQITCLLIMNQLVPLTNLNQPTSLPSLTCSCSHHPSLHVTSRRRLCRPTWLQLPIQNHR